MGGYRRYKIFRTADIEILTEVLDLFNEKVTVNALSDKSDKHVRG